MVGGVTGSSGPVIAADWRTGPLTALSARWFVLAFETSCLWAGRCHRNGGAFTTPKRGNTAMPETTDTTTTETETVPAPEVETSTEPTDTTDEVAKWKALARQNEARAKANADAAKRLEEIENANKSELERERERATDAITQLEQMRIEADRNAVALAKGLTPTQAKRLMGATREELEADADELLADLKASRPSAAASSDGQGRQGEPVGSAKQITSRDQLGSMSSQERLAAYRDGRLDGLMGKS